LTTPEPLSMTTGWLVMTGSKPVDEVIVDGIMTNFQIFTVKYLAVIIIL
jgi:hypothetical protein